jgi:hypothetical protein
VRKEKERLDEEREIIRLARNQNAKDKEEIDKLAEEFEKKKSEV